MNQETRHIIRFRTPGPIEFDGMEGGPWNPAVGKDYVGIVKKVGDDQHEIHFENPDTPGGWEKSEPIGSDRFLIAGTQSIVVMTEMNSETSIEVPEVLLKFLRSEIDSYENYDADTKTWVRCNLNVAQGNLRQMPLDIFAEVMEIEDEAESTYELVDSLLEDAIDLYGGESFLPDIVKDD